MVPLEQNPAMFNQSWAAVAMLSATMGCSFFGGLQLDSVATASSQPSNVAFYLSVSEPDAPVLNLSTSNFRVYENGKLLASDQTLLTLLPTHTVAHHHVVLLLDLSGSLSGELMSSLHRSTAALVQTLRTDQDISVYGFDGTGLLSAFGVFPRLSTGVEPALKSLDDFVAKDPARDLHNAVALGLKATQQSLKRSGAEVNVGTLIVFTQGPDLAGRRSLDDVMAEVESSGVRTYLVTLPHPEDSFENRLPDAQVVHAASVAALPIAFDELASKVQRDFQGYYLVSYCSPARAGKIRTSLEIEYTTLAGHTLAGKVEQDFDATGFGPGCSPQQPPNFRIPDGPSRAQAQ